MPAETPLSPAVFISGTDTGVGKTIVAAALAHHLRGMGLRVGVMKPLESGVANIEQEGPDAALLRWASECQAPTEQVAPVRLKAPLAPSMAAQKEKRFIDFGQLVEASDHLRREHDFVIIEGAGGLMVPVAGGLLIADLVRAMDIPLMIVCRPGLGTINHTLLSVFSAKQMELRVAGFMINRMPHRPDEAMIGAPHVLSSLASADLLGVLKESQEAEEKDRVMELSAQIASLPTHQLLQHNLGWPLP